MTLFKSFSGPMVASSSQDEGKSALSVIKETEPVAWLAAQPNLSQSTRVASEYLFSLSHEYAAHCPLPHLLTHNFDCEQIWQQIDLQATPILRAARRRLKHLERNGHSVALLDGLGVPSSNDDAENETDNLKRETKYNVDKQRQTSSDEEEEQDDARDDPSSHSEEDGEGHTVEDKFFKLKDMERFLDDAEANQGSASPLNLEDDASESEEGQDEGEDLEEGEEEIEDLEEEDDNDDDNNDDDLKASRDKEPKYGDFFGVRLKGKMADSTSRKESNGQSQDQLESLTAHEKQLEKVQKRVKELEEANINPKLWTMQGEVSAAKRPKNSALEVELDFEHNVRPPPVITEEVTASLEDLIRKRIAENNFDDVQRQPLLPLQAPKEQIELDERKSQRGLAELYEADYMQKTGLAPASTSPADEVRKEATRLFKALCIKLDALSHFHFTPKPVIEDMAVRPDVPALALEEVAPLMVSDAQMLAPEEVFRGEGVVKTDAELTREERKRRRAKKKEKARVEKRREEYSKPRVPPQDPQGSLLPRKRKAEQSQYSKSTKVFEQLDEANKNGRVKRVHAQAVPSQDLSAPFLKL